MANDAKINLQVEFAPQIENIKKHKEDLGGLKDPSGKSALDKNPQLVRDLDLLIESIDKLSKVANPGHSEISALVQALVKANEIVLKLANSEGVLSKEMTNLLTKQKEITKQIEDEQKKLDQIQKTGKYDEKTKTFKYSKAHAEGWAKEQDSFVYKSGAHKGKKASWNSIETAAEKGDWSKFEDPAKAQATYQAFIDSQKDQAQAIEECTRNLINFNTELAKVNSSISDQTKIDAARSPGTKIYTEASRDITDTKIKGAELRTSKTKSEGGSEPSIKGVESSADKAVHKQESTFSRVAKKFTIYATIIKTLKSAVGEAKATITELDKELTQQAMVTGKTREETYALVGAYQKLATQCGATTKEVAGVATEYMKQGKTIADSLVLTEAAVSAAKVAGVSTSDSVNYLTTALNGFQLAAEDAMKVSDKFAAVAAASATDYDELAIALSKVASQANLAGMSIDYTTALLTKGLETTREAPETMGTALKTIIARMRELSDYGETLGGDTDINKVEQQLAYVGIALRNQQGELRSTEEVLDELGQKWDTLNKNQQAAVAKALAGTRQQSRLIAMMSDYERVTELQQISMRSAGATMAQMEKYLHSIDAASNKVKVAWETIITTVTDSEFIINTVELFARVLENLNKILNGDAGFLGELVKVGVGLFALSKLLEKGSEKFVAKTKDELALQRELNDLRDEIEAKREAAYENPGEQAEAFKKVEEREDYKEELKNDSELKTAQEEATKDRRIEADADEEEKKAKKEFDDADAALKQAQNELEKAQLDEIALKEEYINWVNEQGLTIKDAMLEKELALNEVLKARAALEEAEKSGGSTEEAQRKLDEAKRIADEKSDAADKKVADFSKEAQAKFEENKKKQEEKREEIKDKKEKVKQKKDAKDQAKDKLDKSKDKHIKANEKLEKSEARLRKAQEANAKVMKMQREEIDKKLDGTKEMQLQQTRLNQLTSEANALGIVGNTIQQALNTTRLIANSFLGIWNFAMTLGVLLSKKSNKEEKDKAKAMLFGAGATGTATGAQWGFNAAMSANPIGAIIVLIMALIAALAALVIWLVVFKDTSSAADKAANSVNKLSAEIYELDQKAQAINNVVDEFDKLDRKILKTNEDLEQMQTLLEQGGELLDNTQADDKESKAEAKEKWGAEDQTEQSVYNSLRTDREKRNFLEERARVAQEEADKKRQEQVKIIKNMNAADRHKLLTSNEANMVQARDALYSINNDKVYEVIDGLKETAKLDEEVAAATERLTEKILDEVDAFTALEYTQDPEKIRKITEALAGAEVDGISVGEILTSDDYDLKDKLDAFRQARESLAGDVDAIKALETAFNEFELFEEMTESALDFIDASSLTYDQINELHDMTRQLNKELSDTGFEITENADEVFKNLLNDLSMNGGNVADSINDVFGDYLNELEYMGEDWVEAWNLIVTKLDNILGKSILDIGQNMDKLKNNINDFYDKARSWGEMSESEKAEFLNDNAELFKGESGEALLRAFESGDYNRIQAELQNNTALQSQTEAQLEDVRQQIKIQESYVGDARNEAWIKQLKDYEKYLMSGAEMYEASLELRIEQEEKQLEIYREFLEKQQEELQDSLDKRKEAYEDYFDAINEQQSNEDYQETFDRLTENISKLSTTTDAASKKQAKELEQQLEELEKERQKELRERAQEAVIEAIDKEVEDINDKFDKLLNNEKLLLEAMQTNMKDPNFTTQLLASAREDGKTNLQIEQFAKELESAFGSSIDTTHINETLEQVMNNATINVGDQVFNLDNEDGNVMWETILATLVKYGYGR